MRITAALLFALAAGCTRDNPGAGFDDLGTDAAAPLDLSSWDEPPMPGPDLFAVDLAGADLSTPPDLSLQVDASGGPIDLAGADLTMGCTPGVACTVAGSGQNGLCPSPNGACAACTDVTDDANCDAVYGAPGSPYLCLAGACVPGNCRSSADCSGGQVCLTASCQPCAGANVAAADAECQSDAVYGAGTICIAGACTPGNCHTDADCKSGTCGFLQPNFCGKCSADSQCPANQICNVSTGACVSNACKVTFGTTCLNPADVCCAATGSTSGTCQPGNCCNSAMCSGGGMCAGANPGNGTAGICAPNGCNAVTNDTWFVDPVNGSDTNGTGSQAGSCAFATITRALQFLSKPAAIGSKIIVAGSGNNVALRTSAAPTEKLPIAIPANVALSVQLSGGGTSVRFNPPAGATGFLLTGQDSSVSGFVLDGAQAATSGVVSTAPTGGNDPTLDRVTVQNFKSNGIVVQPNAALTILSAVHSLHNGTFSSMGAPTSTASGLLVLGDVIIANQNGAPDSFGGNSGHGILVRGAGVLTLNGNPIKESSINKATVVMRENWVAGLMVSQTPSAAGGSPGQCSVTGLLSMSSIAGNGARLEAGSQVSVRDSLFLANALNGVFVSSWSNGSTTVDDVSGIDLGPTGAVLTTFGGNTLQPSSKAVPSNPGAGICLSIAPNAANGTLSAGGNIFSGGRDCSQMGAGTLTTNAQHRCAGAVDYAVVWPSGATSNTNAIVSDYCASP